VRPENLLTGANKLAADRVVLTHQGVKRNPGKKGEVSSPGYQFLGEGWGNKKGKKGKSGKKALFAPLCPFCPFCFSSLLPVELRLHLM
jgi:hypothetical protein